MFPKFSFDSRSNQITFRPNSIIVSVVALFIAVLCTGWFSGNAQAEFVLVAPETIPGNDLNHITPVLTFQFDGIGPLKPITGIAASLVQDPIFVVFGPNQELFVSNRHGNVGEGRGSISRFKLDPTRTFILNGTITGNSLEAVAGLAFSLGGELFAANLLNHTISRFIIDAQGNAIAHSFFVTDEEFNEGLAFAADGELFTTHSSSIIRSWRIDPATGEVHDSNRSISVAGSSRLHGIAFSANNELFVTDLDTNLIYRFLFDGSHNLVSNGSIPVAGGPIGLAFSPTGELFVTSHFAGGITRFTFDTQGNAVQNGSMLPTNQLGGAAIVTLPSAPPPVAVPEPGTLTLLGSGLLSLLGYVTLRRWRRKS
ncbi:MAG: beta-propeller fold lactonase family protein [Caldilineaceae bacterium]